MKIAAITMVFNEQVFLPIWLHHYGRQLGENNLFVIDDGSNDDSTNLSPIVNLVRKRRGALDEDDRARLISFFHEELLRFYDVVLYTDVDELLVVDPSAGLSLGELLAQLSVPCLSAIGFNVIHDAVKESDINVNVPLFRQRRLLQFDAEYCKPLISRRPI